MPSEPSDRFTRNALLTAVALVVAAALAVWLWPPPPPPPPPADARAVVEEFVSRRSAALLGPEATFDLEPVSAAEADRRAADYVLRRPGLRVTGVFDGEPDGAKQKPRTNTFTLATAVNVLTPRQSIGGRDPAAPQYYNPDVVVEVRGGRIHALRTELPLR